MTNGEIKDSADRVLGSILAPHGFTGSDVASGEDETGERALFVTVHFGPGAKAAPGRIMADAISALRKSLLDAGDERFPYLDFDYVDDLQEDGNEPYASPS